MPNGMKDRMRLLKKKKKEEEDFQTWPKYKQKMYTYFLAQHLNSSLSLES